MGLLHTHWYQSHSSFLCTLVDIDTAWNCSIRIAPLITKLNRNFFPSILKSCLVVIEKIIAVTPILTGLVHAVININITVFSSPSLFTKTIIVIDQVITKPIVTRIWLTFINLYFTVRSCVACKIVTNIVDLSGAFNTTWYAVTNPWNAVLHTFSSIETGKPLTLLQRTQLSGYSGVWPQLIEKKL